MFMLMVFVLSMYINMYMCCHLTASAMLTQ
jgi:hypothetical protein